MGTLETDVEESRRKEIEKLLERFMLALDEKDWRSMRSSLAERIDSDESGLGVESPTEIPRDQYVSKRQLSISHLKTRHSLSHVRIDLFQEGHPTLATVFCDFTILRFLPYSPDEEAGRFHSCGRYRFIVELTVELTAEPGLRKCSGERSTGFTEAWLIRSISEIGLKSEGNPGIYGAVQTSPR